MSKSDDKSHDYKVAIFSAILSVFIPFIIDYFKDVSFGTTIKNIFLWIWHNIFNLKLSLWLIILIYLSWLMMKVLYKQIKLNDKIEDIAGQTETSFLNYTFDEFKGVLWSWEYKWDVDTYKIINLSPECGCGTKTKMYWDGGARCPNCSKSMGNLKSKSDIELIIVDKVKKNKFQT